MLSPCHLCPVACQRTLKTALPRPPLGALTPPGRQGAPAAAPFPPTPRRSSSDSCSRLQPPEPAGLCHFRGSAEKRAGPGCRPECSYISATQAALLSLCGSRGRSSIVAAFRSLLLLTHRCSLSPRNKSVRKPRRSHGEAEGHAAGLRPRRHSAPGLALFWGPMPGWGEAVSKQDSPVEFLKWWRNPVRF